MYAEQPAVFMSVFTKQCSGASGMRREQRCSLKRRGKVAAEKVGSDGKNYGSSSGALITGGGSKRGE